MIDLNLSNYIRQCRAQGIGREEIKKSLLEAGWQETDVDEALGMQPTAQLDEPLSYEPVVHRFNKKLLAILVAVGVLVLGGGATAYFYFVEQSPEKVMQKMYTNLANVKSVEWKLESETKMSGEIFKGLSLPQISPGATTTPPTKDAKGEIIATVNLTGGADWKEKGHTKFKFSLDVATTGDDAKNDFQTGFEGRYLDSGLYLQLTKLPLAFPFGLDVLKNNWLKIDIKGVSKKYLEEDNRPQNKLRDEQIQGIKEAWLKANPVSVVSRSSEKIEDMPVYHFVLAMNKEGYREFVLQVAKILELGPAGGELQKTIEKQAELLEFTRLEVWIGKKDYLPYKFLTESKNAFSGEQELRFETSATLYLKNYNKSVEVTAPSPVKTPEELFRELFGNLATSSGTPAVLP